MIKFNELRITNDGNLYIDASVYSIINPDTNKDLYKDVYIKRIRVYSYKEYVSESDFGKPLFDSDTYRNPITGNTDLYDKLTQKTTKDFSISLSSIDLYNADMVNTLFFVTISCYGAADGYVPCTMQKETTIGVVWNTCLQTHDMMSYCREILSNPCHEVPTDMILTFFSYELLTYAVKTCNYTQLIDLWKSIIASHANQISASSLHTNCNCK